MATLTNQMVINGDHRGKLVIQNLPNTEFTGFIETWSSRIGHGMGFKQQGCTAVAGLSSLLCHECMQNVPGWRVPNIECFLGRRAPKPEGWTAASLEDFKGKLSIKIIKADRRSRKLEIPGSYKVKIPRVTGRPAPPRGAGGRGATILQGPRGPNLAISACETWCF